MTTQQLVLADCFALLLLCITAYLTRATRRRLVGALVAGIVVALLVVTADVYAHSRGWWIYPAATTSYGPPLMYVAVFLWYGAGVALVGWRLTRRFGWRGQVAFIAFMAVYGPVRDYLGAAFTHAIVFAPGLLPVIGDGLCWAGGMALAQAVMSLIAGLPKSDPLARTTVMRS